MHSLIRQIRAILYLLALTACGGGGMTSAPTPALQSSIQISSLSASSSLPLIALKIATSGGTTTDPVTVNFSNSSGFSVSTKALTVKAGTVVSSIPLFVDPITSRVGSGEVSVALTQNGKSSNSVRLTIQDLPPLSTYGTSVGQITRAYMIFESLMLGHTLNEIQTVRPALATDTATAAKMQNASNALYVSLIPASYQARVEVEKLIKNSGLTFAWGTLNGKALQFDAKQLEFMDRIIGLHLQQVFASSSPSAVSNMARATAVQGTLVPVSLTKVLTDISTYSTALSIANSIRKAGEDRLNDLLAGSDGLTMWGKAVDNKDFVETVGLAAVFPRFAAATTGMLNSIIPTAICNASGCDNASELATIVENNGRDVATAAYQTFATTLGTAGFLSESFVSGSDSFLASTEIYKAIQRGDFTNLWDATKSAVRSPRFPDAIASLGVVTGTTSVTYPSELSSRLPGIQLRQCVAGSCNGNFNTTGVVDPSGNYELFVPLRTTGIDYSHMNILAFDYVSNTGIASSEVDLTGLDATRPVRIPITLSGTYSVPATSPSINFSASSNTLTVGASVVLTWTTLNANACSASGSWSGGQAVNGSTSLKVQQGANTYSLACTSANGGSSTKTVTVTGTPAATFTLSTFAAGTGSGTFTSTNLGTTCGLGCASYPAGTIVQLSAAANAGSTFSGWIGACTGTGTCSVSMTQNQSLTANFALSSSDGSLSGSWSGTWTRPVFGFCSFETSSISWSLTQSGNSVSGTYRAVVTAIDTSGLCPDSVGATSSGSLLSGVISGNSLAIITDGGTQFNGTYSSTTISGTGGTSAGTGPFSLTKR